MSRDQYILSCACCGGVCSHRWCAALCLEEVWWWWCTARQSDVIVFLSIYLCVSLSHYLFLSLSISLPLPLCVYFFEFSLTLTVSVFLSPSLCISPTVHFKCIRCLLLICFWVCFFVIIRNNSPCSSLFSLFTWPNFTKALEFGCHKLIIRLGNVTC